MKKLLGLLVLLACAGGCVVAVDDNHRHDHREAPYERGHNHGDGCGHVQVRGVWYLRN